MSVDPEGTPGCLDEHLVRAVLEGRDVSPGVIGHLRGCSRCRERLSQLGASEATSEVLVAGGRAGGEPTSRESLASLWRDLQHPSRASSSIAEGEGFPAAIGKYRVLGRLGDRGGQATVYRAWHPLLEKEVVIKLGRLPSAQDRQRVLAEGRIAAQLQHPYLGRLLDLDFHEDQPYLVLELVRGRSLHQIRTDSMVAPQDAARSLAKVARALEHLHAKGVVHRDVKPANIVLDEAGDPHLLDLGLALVRDALREEEPEEGSISGTVVFMSPEQARGEPEGNRPATDIFSLGAVLYFLLVGRAPFERPGEKDYRAALERARRCELDQGALETSGAPKPLVQVCLKAMEADPAARYRSAGAMAAALEAFGRARKTAPWVAAASVVVGAIVFALLLRIIWPPEPDLRRAGPAQLGLIEKTVMHGDLLAAPDEALPVRTDDALRLSWRIPAQLETALFWIDSEGRVIAVEPQIVQEPGGEKTVSYPAGQDKHMNVVGKPGTEMILVCARKGKAPTQEEVEDWLAGQGPWPELPETLWLQLNRDNVWTELGGKPRDSRAPGFKPRSPEGAHARAEELRKTLGQRCDWFSGIAFPHVR